jgi:hypothetical protein
MAEILGNFSQNQGSDELGVMFAHYKSVTPYERVQASRF